MNKYIPTGMNLELTTCCPLRCPQCYCTLEGGKHLDFEIAKKRVFEACNLGVKQIHMSGGETMCYPHLYSLISFAKKNGATVNVALSGYKFDQSAYEKIVSSGVDGIFISLNGSTKEINEKTRDGFDLAIQALTLLKNNGFNKTYINWVMHSYNSSDFLNMLNLAEKFNVAGVVVLAFKPDSKKHLDSFPSKEQIYFLAECIRNYKGNVKIGVESCFSQLLAVIKETKLFGNLNTGEYKGCRAGTYNFSINVDGDFSPCRHIDCYEKYDSVESYWNNSKMLNKIRDAESNKKEPCLSCIYSNYCRHCLAVNYKLFNGVYIGNTTCPVYKAQNSL